jgi:hypothetical protein
VFSVGHNGQGDRESASQAADRKFDTAVVGFMDTIASFLGNDRYTIVFIPMDPKHRVVLVEDGEVKALGHLPSDEQRQQAEVAVRMACARRRMIEKGESPMHSTELASTPPPQ